MITYLHLIHVITHTLTDTMPYKVSCILLRKKREGGRKTGKKRGGRRKGWRREEKLNSRALGNNSANIIKLFLNQFSKS